MDERRPKTHEKGKEMARARGPRLVTCQNQYQQSQPQINLGQDEKKIKREIQTKEKAKSQQKT